MSTAEERAAIRERHRLKVIAYRDEFGDPIEHLARTQAEIRARHDIQEAIMDGGVTTTEPVATADVVKFVGALLTLAVALGYNIDDNLNKAIMAFVVAAFTVGSLLLTLWSRSRVTPVAKAEAKITEAYHANAMSDPKPKLTDPVKPL